MLVGKIKVSKISAARLQQTGLKIESTKSLRRRNVSTLVKTLFAHLADQLLCTSNARNRNRGSFLS